MNRASSWSWWRGYSRACIADTYHTLRNRGDAMLFLASGTIAALSVAYDKVRWSGEQSRLAAKAAEDGRDWLPPETGNAFGPFVDGISIGLAVGILFLLIRTASLIAQERDSGTIRWGLTQTASRTQLTSSKATQALLLALGLLGATILGSWLSASALFEFAAYEEDQFVIYEAAEIRAEVMRAILIAAPSLLATAWFGLFVSAISRSGGQAIAISLTGYVGFDLFKGGLQGYEKYVFATYNPSVSNQSYLAEASKVAQGFSDFGWESEAIRLALVLPTCQALFFAMLTILMMRRRTL